MSGRVEERMMVLVCASGIWYSCCLVCRSKSLMDLSEDPEMMNLLSVDTATEHTGSTKEDKSEVEERMIVLVWASGMWCSSCFVCRSKIFMELSADPETMNLLSFDTATDST